MKLKLNKQLKAAILSTSPRILINAGPGTGKSTALACRAIHVATNLVQGNQRVAVVTLTNYAAGELWKKILKLSTNRKLKPIVGPVSTRKLKDAIDYGTFHSWAWRIANQYGLNRGKVVDQGRELEIWKQIIAKVKPVWKKDEEILEHLTDINSLRKTRGKTISSIIKSKHSHMLDDLAAVKRIIQQADKEITAQGLITFDDMICGFNELLDSPKKLKSVVGTYPYLIMDEFQDTTYIQWEIVKKFLKTNMSILAAGDDSQTVYVWAGASFKRFEDFRKAAHKTKEFHFTKNRRSTKEIVELSNALTSQSRYVNPKIATSPTKGKKPVVICKKDHRQIHKHIIKQIHKYHKINGSYKGILVNYRFYMEASYLMPFLDAERIPYRVFGDKSSRTRPIVRFIFSLINIIEKKSTDKDDWMTVLMALDGIGAAKWKPIHQWIKKNNPILGSYTGNNKDVKNFLSDIDGLQNKHLSNIDLFSGIVKMARSLILEPRQFRRHVLPTLYWLCHESKSPFLYDIRQEYNDMSFPLYYPHTQSPPYPSSYVTLSNIHRIKGGGYDTVLFLGADDMIFKKYKSFMRKASLESELQLMNVAVTRSCKELYFFFKVKKKDFPKSVQVENPVRFICSSKRNLYKVL